MTDCKKRADIVLRIKQLDTLIAGYSRLLTLPECPGNTVLMQMTRKEKIDGIAKKGTFECRNNCLLQKANFVPISHSIYRSPFNDYYRHDPSVFGK
ncbi:hypothetical protein TNCT_254451 [Trichonephila clavata]|uniref:Uncharacterized protein n=1 Tax=Trichonephila clavata TaxID=2740835 RepID=A0A8X6GFF6_TRICU|nr:hypothetical protein TNCT_254451 [Trichonephila clavata]